VLLRELVSVSWPAKVRLWASTKPAAGVAATQLADWLALRLSVLYDVALLLAW
jgi:hypothetical protein